MHIYFLGPFGPRQEGHLPIVNILEHAVVGPHLSLVTVEPVELKFLQILFNQESVD